MFVALQRYADFSGRSHRTEYWMFTLFYVLVTVVLGILALATGAFEKNETGEPGGAFWLLLVLFGLFALAMFVPSLAVQVRRFHDQDKSGWFVLLSLIPYVGGLIVLVFMVLPGTRGGNRFGPDPLQTDRDVAEVFN